MRITVRDVLVATSVTAVTIGGVAWAHERWFVPTPAEGTVATTTAPQALPAATGAPTRPTVAPAPTTVASVPPVQRQAAPAPTTTTTAPRAPSPTTTTTRPTTTTTAPADRVTSTLRIFSPTGSTWPAGQCCHSTAADFTYSGRAPRGTITITINGSPLCTQGLAVSSTDAGTQCGWPEGDDVRGNYSVAATYSGDGIYPAMAAPVVTYTIT